ncbi:uncharacterized protein [Ptychodera flava]|uniref:uncharacterized protein n=1 Tax=Ptychodera flava TaxID=63121 RepID=UPI00396A235F
MPTVSLTWILPNASDNSGTFRMSGSHEPGSKFSIGITTISYTVEDPSGNTASCWFNITVKDTEKPNVICPSNIETKIFLDMPVVSLTWTLPNVSDNSGTVSMSGSHEPGSNFSIGITTVSYKAKDPSGNTAFCWFNVTVKGVARPLFEDKNGTQPSVSPTEAIERFSKLSKAIDDLSHVNVSADEVQVMAQDILQSMNDGIAVLKNAAAENEESNQDRNLLTESVLNAADSLANFVLRNIEPSSGPVVLETPSLRLNLESDNAEKLTNTSVMIGDGNGFRLPTAEALFQNSTQQRDSINRIVKRLNRRSFQHGSKASDILSLSFTDREGNQIRVNDTKEDIAVIFSTDPVTPEIYTLIDGVYIEADNITYYRSKANISHVPHAAIIHLDSSDEIYTDITAYIFEDLGVKNSTEYTHYKFSVDEKFYGDYSSIFIPEQEFSLTGEYNITFALPQRHDVKLSMYVKQIMCGYMDERSGTWNSDGCKDYVDSVPFVYHALDELF